MLLILAPKMPSIAVGRARDRANQSDDYGSVRGYLVQVPS